MVHRLLIRDARGVLEALAEPPEAAQLIDAAKRQGFTILSDTDEDSGQVASYTPAFMLQE